MGAVSISLVAFLYPGLVMLSERHPQETRTHRHVFSGVVLCVTGVVLLIAVLGPL